MKLGIGATAGAAFLLVVGAGISSATPPILAEAKKAGLPATNCQYCHTEAMPKKDTFKPDALNDRGKFLMSDMQKRNATTPDLKALKEYVDSQKK
jgi:hypothetical protein